VTLAIFVSREARADITEAIRGFRDISPALSVRFQEELERVYSGMAEYPQMYPIVYKKFRRALLRRFPYSIFYIVEESFILVIGVVHQARDESTWKRRA
jgi:plasmid stabilization system protein ParE